MELTPVCVVCALIPYNRDVYCLFTVMARLNLTTRDMIKKKKLTSVLMFWLDLLSVVISFFELLCVMVEYRIRKKSLRATYFIDFYSRQGDIHHLIYKSDETCKDHFRMDRNAFSKLCNMLEARGGLKATKHMLVDEQVAMFLYILAHHVKNRIVKRQFKRSGETISRHFKSVLHAVIRLHAEFLEKPEPILETSTDEKWKWFKVYYDALLLSLCHSTIILRTYILCLCIKNCLGALDGTHIRVRVPLDDKPRYRNRKGEITTNVLGVCSQKMQFIYVLAGWEGSAADGRVLRDAINRRNGLKVPHGKESIFANLIILLIIICTETIFFY